MPQSAKEEVNITALIQGILNGYPGNSAIFREYLQNSDDAKAKKQTFILDERIHSNESILDPELRGAQGPALIAVNDGVLSDSDWKALKSIHSSSKKSDETQTGKNGLGFRASYHLTENPHVLSGDCLMVLDPHHRFKVHPGGMSINVVDEGRIYNDQLQPFAAAVDDPFQSFNGTAFRLPLRTIEQAEKSKIKASPTSVAEINQLLHSFGENDLEDTIRFLKHITTIEIRHISPTGVDKLVGRVTIDPLPSTLDPNGTLTRTTTWTKLDGTVKTRQWFYRHRQYTRAEANKIMAERLGYDIGDALSADKLTPTVELAIPLDEATIRGALHTLLPLPIKTGFPLHLNAVFALTPDRQSLKNIEETGASGSRERRLVEWNRLILEGWVPITWVDILVDLASRRDGWSIWPPADKTPYWKDLTLNVVKEVIRRKVAIFPTISHHGQSSLVALEDRYVLLASMQATISLDLLSSLGLKIVQPPAHIFDILTVGDLQVAASTLSPAALHRVLLDGYRQSSWLSHNTIAIDRIIDYLVFSTSEAKIAHLVGLPWFQACNGSNVTFGALGSSPTYIIAETEEEASLFALHPQLLAWTGMSDSLRRALLLPQSSRVLAVMALNADHVHTVLQMRLQSLAQSEVDGSTIQWVINFWRWLERWSNRSLFFAGWSKISSLLLLPTTTGTLERISNKVALLEGLEASAIGAWQKLGVPILHSAVTRSVATMLSDNGYIETPQTAGFIPFLLSACRPGLQENLLPQEFTALQASLYAALVQVTTRSVVLNSAQKETLASLAIFSVRNTQGGPSILNSVSGNRFHVKLGNDFPLPVQNSEAPVVYVDLRERETEALIKLLEPVRAQSAFDLLRIAVSNWRIQPEPLQDTFIDHIFDNSRKLPSDIQDKLADLPFVTVNGSTSRAPPKSLIHPNSTITSLYDGEPGKIPTGHFASSSYVMAMQYFGFLPASIDGKIVEERLRYLSGSISHDLKAFEKACQFIQLVDRNWSEDYRSLVVNYRNHAWLPLSSPCALISPDKSRDNHHDEHAHPSYYDFELQVFRPNVVLIRSSGLRSAVGWSDRVPIGVLFQQLRMTLQYPGDDRNARLTKLIGYLSRLHDMNRLSSGEVDSLRSLVDGRPWIPVTSYAKTSTEYGKASTEIVSSDYALLSDIALKYPFRPVLHVGSRAFLRRMGCTERPTLNALMTELKRPKEGHLSSLDVDAMAALLREIASYHKQAIDPSSLPVPGHDSQVHTLDQVYYPDDHVILVPEALRSLTATHRSISRTLSDDLGIQPLSSLMLDLGADAFDDDDQMAEDLVDRLRGFLREYDISYAFNEVLANADDAAATNVSIMLDTRRHSPSSTGVIFRAAQEAPSIIFHNNATLTDADFKGLRKVGRGGKVGQTDTHGRHGLGSLSFYYFTDVVTVISGKNIMILDPSGRHLPPNRGQKRTAVTMKISDMTSLYPNQLNSFESLFNFSKSASNYEGTLFCLPLNASIAAKHCDITTAQNLLEKSYRSLAKNAFFFTNLTHISAVVSSHVNKRTMWSFSGHRNPRCPLGHGHDYHSLTVSSGAGENEEWFIASSTRTAIPAAHAATATGLKLTNTNMSVQLAIRFPLTLAAPECWLFSTLRLPKQTSLPFHLNARFAISSNRQSIVFDSPDHRQKRDPKSAFNLWILSDIVPSLYLSSLEFLIRDCIPTRLLPEGKWWLMNASDRDEISKHVDSAFRDLIPRSRDSKLFKTDSQEPTDALLSFADAIFAKSPPDDKIIRALGILKAPRLVTPYYSTVAHLPSARIVDAGYVKEVLAHHVSLSTVQRLHASQTLTSDLLINLLLYLRGETSLAGMPLLLLTTNVPTSIPGPHDERIYLSGHQSYPELFSMAKFLAVDYSDKVFQQLWSSRDINVADLTSDEATQLIGKELARLTDDEEKERWLKKFWVAYPNLPGPPGLESLENAGFNFVRGSTRHFSLRECQPDQVVYFSDSHQRNELRPILERLGIEVLRSTGNHILKKFLTERFPSPIVSVLKCMQNKDIKTFTHLTDHDAEIFLAWLHSEMDSSLFSWQRNSPGVAHAYLTSLVIWQSYTRQGAVQCSASSLQILPSHFPVEVLQPYLLQDRNLAVYSQRLVSFFKYCRNFHNRRNGSADVTMSAQDIWNAIEIPSTIVQSDRRAMTAFALFLRKMFDVFSLANLAIISNSLRVFDGNGLLRPLSALYDHSVPLLSTSLALPDLERSSFIHPTLRTLSLDILRSLGLNHQITVETFRVCAEGIQTALMAYVQGGSPSLHDLHEMSRVAFGCYVNTLPSMIMRNVHSWASLDDIAFVRPKVARRQGASYDAEPYCVEELGRLLAPSKFVLPSLEAIAWTQRALFFDEPGENVTALNTKLGVPEVHEVVAHLIVLTTKIAQDHPGNSTLQSDITATYKWLNENADTAREHLILAQDKKLFLNVDDASTDWWPGKWMSASEMVLNLPYDSEAPGAARVRKFLQPFEKLLQAAGCDNMKMFERDHRKAQGSGNTSTTQTAIMKAFDEMRQEGEMTDMVFVPLVELPGWLEAYEAEANSVPNAPDSGTDTPLSDVPPALPTVKDLVAAAELRAELRGHRAFLAAALPHFRLGGQGWKDSQGERVQFYGSEFGAKAILDFVYTGDFVYSVPLNDDLDGLTTLLDELLLLLEIADRWDIPDLKTKVEMKIIHGHDFVQRLLSKHSHMMEVAELHNATQLKDALEEVQTHNAAVLKRFSIVSE